MRALVREVACVFFLAAHANAFSQLHSLNMGISDRVHEDSAFTSWAELQHIHAPKLRLVRKNGVRCVICTEDIALGEWFLQVPLSVCLYAWGSENTVFGQVRDFREKPMLSENEGRCDDWAEPLPWRLQLVNVLLREVKKQTSSKWCDYIKALPTDFTNLPLHWTASDLAIFTRATQTLLAVNISDSIAANKAWRARAVKEYVRAEGVIPSRTQRELIEWALDIIQTRGCRVELPGGHQLRLLVPFFDMINHRAVESHFEIDSYTNCFRVKYPTTALRAGEEVLINYGDRTSFSILLGYGFVPRDSSQERVTIPLSSASTDFIPPGQQEQTLEKCTVSCTGPSTPLVKAFLERATRSALLTGTTNVAARQELHYQICYQDMLVHLCDEVVKSQQLRRAAHLLFEDSGTTGRSRRLHSLVCMLLLCRARTLFLCACSVAKDFANLVVAQSR